MATLFRIPKPHGVTPATAKQQMLKQRKALIRHVLQQAVGRGEITADVITDELWDLLPGYLIFRSIIPDRPPTRRTVRALVDGFLIPGLTRNTR